MSNRKFIIYIPVWIESTSSVSAFYVFFFFFSLRSTFQCISVGSVHSLWKSQTSFFNKTFIKNESHCTIHTFINYFVTLFSIFSKISGIQTDPMCANHYVPRVYNFKNVISWIPCQHFVKPRRI